MIIFFVVLFTLVIVIGCHELGHAVTAHFFSVKIERISIGFGKPLCSWRGRHGPVWVWSMWPLGGYVKLFNTRIENVSPEDLPFCFDQKPIWIRCLIALAGSLTNILLAWVLLSLVGMMGQKQWVPVIGDVAPASIAAQAGIRAGDRIVDIRNVAVNNWFEVSVQLIANLGKETVPLTLAGKTVRTRTIDLSHIVWSAQHPSFFSYFGFQPDVRSVHQFDVKPLGFWDSLFKSFDMLRAWFLLIVIMLKQLLTGVLPLAALMGPLSFFSTVSDVFFAGITPFISFLALLSFVTGLINLLPVPGLDGAALVYAGIEKLRKKPISQAMEILLYRLAMIVFALLLLQLILNDVQKWLTVWAAQVAS